MDVLSLVNKIQAQLTALDKKVDVLIQRSMPKTPQVTASAKAPVVNNQHKARMMYTAICADCKKECSIPFKPSGDRPVYCQDCFSRRKVINLSGMKFEQAAQTPRPIQAPSVKHVELPNNTQKVKAKKKAVMAKKTAVKKKPAVKKNKKK